MDDPLLQIDPTSKRNPANYPLDLYYIAVPHTIFDISSVNCVSFWYLTDTLNGLGNFMGLAQQ